MHNVTVLIPVGPHYRKDWLQEAISSVMNQTYPVNEILLIDDGAKITDQDMHEIFGEQLSFSKIRRQEIVWWLGNITISKWNSPANIGFAQAFNCGMALADNELVLYLAADDTLAPSAVQDCIEAYVENNEKDAWYALTYESADGICDIPINACMLTRNLFNYIGGYPPAAFAGPDAVALSILMYWNSDLIIKVNPGKVNYFIKKHDLQETKVTAQRFSEEMTTIRTKLTLDFKPKEGIVLK